MDHDDWPEFLTQLEFPPSQDSDSTPVSSPARPCDKQPEVCLSKEKIACALPAKEHFSRPSGSLPSSLSDCPTPSQHKLPRPIDTAVQGSQMGAEMEKRLSDKTITSPPTSFVPQDQRRRELLELLRPPFKSGSQV